VGKNNILSWGVIFQPHPVGTVFISAMQLFRVILINSRQKSLYNTKKSMLIGVFFFWL